MVDNKKVILCFKRNIIGEYNYSSPLFTSLLTYSYLVNFGENKGRLISYNTCFHSNELFNKMKEDKPVTVGLKSATKIEDGEYLYIVIGEEVEKYVFEQLKKMYGRNPSNEEFLINLILYSDKIGKNTERLFKNKNGFSVETKGLIDNIVGDKDVVRSTLGLHKNSASSEATIGTNTKYSKADSVLTNGSKKENKFINLDDKSKNKSKSLGNAGKVNVSKIKEKIKKKIIGQDVAIDTVVNNIYLNQKLLEMNDMDMIRNKANIILDGPTGTGKTFLLSEVANELSLPISLSSATDYSTVGYKGADIVEILQDLLRQTDGNLELAERGIVVFDEVDKLGSVGSGELTMRRSIQHELLPLISGKKMNVLYNDKNYSFDTSKLTFIAMGAFTDLRERKIKENEKKRRGTIGFSSTSDDDIERKYTVDREDYINEGLEREFVGRFTCVTYTNELSVKDLERVLIESISSPLNSLYAIGTIMGCKIIVSPEIIHQIAQMAYNTNTGARALIGIVQTIKDVVANDLIDNKKKEIVISSEILNKSMNIYERQYYDRKEYH